MEQNPGEALEYFVADRIRETLQEPGEARPGGRGKPVLAFLAFFLGVTLILQSLLAAGAQVLMERDLSPRFVSDWQETDLFREEISSCLRDFLTLGAGGQLDFYDNSYWLEFGPGDFYGTEVEEGTCIIQSEAVGEAASVFGVRPFGSVRKEAVDSGAAPKSQNENEPVPQSKPEVPPDASYQADKNVLYLIIGGEGENRRVYQNTTSSQAFFEQRTNGDYNFYLIFSNGKAQIWKDDVELDVYGSGYYDGDSQWFLPGYDNFPASEQLNGVYVYMAIRANPARYYSVDYQTGQQYFNSNMYYIAQRVNDSRQFYAHQAIWAGAGALLLCVAFALRKYKRLADAKIAVWTRRVWTEVRALILLGMLLLIFLPQSWQSLYWNWQDYWWRYVESGELWIGQLLYGIAAIMGSNFLLTLALIWFFWLLYNDHRYNPKGARRSLLRPFFRGLRAKDLKRPIEKRISRMGALCGLAVAMLELELIFFLVVCSVRYFSLPVWSLWTLFLLPLLIAAALVVRNALRQETIARDLGLLADQVEAVRAGNLSAPLKLPEDADLQTMADSLNDIQAGMKTALAEQTRSERMKVELVSNVSHDLKTPLTSILSYAELLRQEDLPPAAADYARIIDEKAQRLKGMVQDVFEISKAAADQLPVHLERLDLAKLLRQTLADLDGPIQRSALTFKVDLPAEPVMITADGKRLYRIFQNLIDNALRYALDGSRVYLTLTTSGEQADVSVRNTSRTELPEGVDFTARFVRGDASRSDGGSGLGLSIVRSFAEACGGRFRVETVADFFTAVVTFPLSR